VFRCGFDSTHKGAANLACPGRARTKMAIERPC
jgi:hypothetical protein